MNERYLLDAVVTVVDAKRGLTQLKDFSEAQRQVAFADRLLVSKTDVTAEGRAERRNSWSACASSTCARPIREVHFGGHRFRSCWTFAASI